MVGMVMTCSSEGRGNWLGQFTVAGVGFLHPRTGGDVSLSAEPPAEAPEDALTWKCLKGLLLRMFCTRICRAEAEGLAAAPCSHVPASVRDNPAASRMIAFSEM